MRISPNGSRGRRVEGGSRSRLVVLGVGLGAGARRLKLGANGALLGVAQG